jgi:hypothetical protein
MGLDVDEILSIARSVSFSSSALTPLDVRFGVVEEINAGVADTFVEVRVAGVDEEEEEVPFVSLASTCLLVVKLFFNSFNLV